MPRGLSDDQVAAVSRRHVGSLELIFFDFPGEPIRFNSGYARITALGHNWSPWGDFGQIEGLDQERAIRGGRITIGLLGIPSSAVSGSIVEKVNSTRYQGRALQIYRQPVDPETFVPICDPFIIWSGYADYVAFKTGESVNITLSAEHYASQLRRASKWRMTIHSHNTLLGIDPAGDDADLFHEHNNRLNSRPTRST